MSYEDVMTRQDVHPYNREYVKILREFASRKTFTHEEVRNLVRPPLTGTEIEHA